MAIHLGRPSPDASRNRPERRRERPARRSRQNRGRLPLLLGLAPGGVCPAAAVAGGAVRSYRTISPLPPMPSHEAIPGTTGLGGMFLWHFPWGRPRRALPGTVPPWSPDFPPSRRPQGRKKSGHPTVWHGTIWDALRLLQTGPANRERGAPDRIPRRIGTTMRLRRFAADTAQNRGLDRPLSPARHPMRAWLGPDPCGDSAHRTLLSMLNSTAAPGWPGPRRKADGV